MTVQLLHDTQGTDKEFCMPLEPCLFYCPRFCVFVEVDDVILSFEVQSKFLRSLECDFSTSLNEYSTNVEKTGRGRTSVLVTNFIYTKSHFNVYSIETLFHIVIKRISIII